MARLQMKLRYAIGLLKDQTSISIAKVASGGAPDLEVAIVKATSHDEVPFEEKYVQVVLHLTSFSHIYVNACICNLARRFNKTQNWIVAIKVLILVHRLIRDADGGFQKELILSRKRGMRVLHVPGFRDESHPNGWDFSAFVRAYGLYLEDRLDCCSIGSLMSHHQSDRSSSYKYEYSDGSQHSNGNGSSFDDGEKQSEKEKTRSVKDMTLDELMENVPIFQKVLERVLACRPTGPAKLNRLVHVALYAVVRESFMLYEDLRAGLAMLHEAFFDMDSRNSRRVLEIFSRAAKQVDEIVNFYSFCKSLGVCKTAKYPDMEVIPKEMLQSMDDSHYVSGQGSRRKRGPEPKARMPLDEGEGEADQDINDMKALPCPPLPAGEPPSPGPMTNTKSSLDQDSNIDLINVREPVMSAEEHGGKLALALFAGTKANAETAWEAFPVQVNSMTRAGNGAAGWELALIESESEPSKQIESTLAGGFDHWVLDSLYEQGVDRQRMLSVTVPIGSASTVALPSRPQSNYLALPAPLTAAAPFSNDPFAASRSVPSPPYVQMPEMSQKQQLLVQEQQQWLYYQHGDMQAHPALVKYPNNPFASPFQAAAHEVSDYGPKNPFHH